MRAALLCTFILLITISNVAAQSEWIDYGQTYYKIPTATDRVHRITFAALAASGLNPATINPQNIRMFHRGEEVAIAIQTAESGKFGVNDFIDFYGKRNDGTLDAKLYTDPAHVGNKLYNTHNDSTAFFLTITPNIAGKRMVVRNQSVANSSEVSIYQTDRLELYPEQYSLSRTYNPGIRLAAFEEGQGWMSSPITKASPRTLVFNNLGSVAASGDVRLEIGITGRSETPHVTTVSAGATIGSLREVGRFEFSGFQALDEILNLQPSDFNADGSIAIRISSTGPDAVDNVSVGYAKLTYPKQVASGDFESEMYITPQGNRQIKLQNVLSNYIAFEVSDIGNVQQIAINKTGNELSFQAEVANVPSRILVTNVLNIVEVEKITSVRFRNVLAQQADFILVSNKFLRRPTANYTDPVKAYAAHRASPLGGGYDTLVVNVDELYDQFNYGEKSPLGIYEFLRTYYPIHKPEHMLLAGRSMGMYSTGRAGNVNVFYRHRPDVFNLQDMIPPAGYPYADNNYSIGLDPANPNVTAVSIGRIPARVPEEIATYLEKIIEKDAVGATEEWQKELIHLSGGVSAFELERYFNFLNGFKDIAEGPYMGGNVTTYRKRSNSTIELIDISGDVNRGTSLITFFGHGAPSVIDIEIGFATDPTMGYANRGKYPMLLLNGCDAGNAFGNAYTFGEDWILAPAKGASNFMAHASVGVDVFLRRYSESFYAKAFSDSSMIYQPIGKVIRETEKLFFERFGQSVVNRSHTEQLVMLGDPAVRLFPAHKADYAITDEEVLLNSFDGDPFNALADSLKLTFVIRNLGRVDMDSLEFKIGRRLPDGTNLEYPSVLLPTIYRKDTINFSIPNTGLTAFGDNIFTIELNPSKSIPEMTYINNTVTVTRFVPLSGTLHLLPFEFGIVSSPAQKLIAQIPGKSVEQRNLILQLDTQADFTSSTRRETRITTAGLATWDIDLFQNITKKDSLTFYWRSRFLEPRAGESDDWTTTSFTYINEGPEGWIQRSGTQLGANVLDNLEIDRTRKVWKYPDTKLNVGVFTFGNQTDSLTFRNTQFYLDGVPYIIDNVNNANSRLCPDGSLGLVAFEQKSLTPYLPIPVPGFDILDGRSCGRVPQVIQSIRNAWITQPGQTFIFDYIDGLNEGDYVVIFSVGNVTFEQWPDAAYEKMKEVGANEALLRNLKNGDPYILYGRKGMAPGEALEIVGQRDIDLETNQQIVEFETDLEGYFTSGSILTPRIGPASEWKLFFNNVNQRDWFNEELSFFDVIGVKNTGEEEVLFANLKDGQLDLQSINSDAFPHLRMRYVMEDDASTAPSHLDKWQVNFTGVPEGVLLFKNKEEQLNLQEGEEAVLNFEFINISNYDFLDSLTVEWTFDNTTQRKSANFSKRIPALKAGEGHEFTIGFNSIGWGGNVEVSIFANPRIIREQTFRNNLIDLGRYIVVIPDNSSAVLDVNFDGIYIMDGDIVSPTVMITTLLKNENSLLLKKDTVGLELYLKKQCEGCQFERINFSNPKINWTEATESSSFKIEMQPGPFEDGIYTFRVITEELGVDKPYEVNFEVINEATITNFYPYPNPFSSSVRFVFTVTGSEVPDQVKIQIMTVTGRVVREILQDELGPLRIGNNISEYAWDGRDEFGDQLANGVYIYRALVRKNGMFMEPRATAGDKAFKQGYGKMYLLR